MRELLRSLTKISDEYREKYMKIKFNSGDQLPLNKMKEIPSMIIVGKAVFHKRNKYRPQVFLNKCLYWLWIIAKCDIMIELAFLKELMLRKQANQKIAKLVITGIF